MALAGFAPHDGQRPLTPMTMAPGVRRSSANAGTPVLRAPRFNGWVGQGTFARSGLAALETPRGAHQHRSRSRLQYRDRRHLSRPAAGGCQPTRSVQAYPALLHLESVVTANLRGTGPLEIRCRLIAPDQRVWFPLRLWPDLFRRAVRSLQRISAVFSVPDGERQPIRQPIRQPDNPMVDLMVAKAGMGRTGERRAVDPARPFSPKRQEIPPNEPAGVNHNQRHVV